MSELHHLFQQYDAAAAEVTALEAKVTEAKERKSVIAKDIKERHGVGPHEKDGKPVIVMSSRGGSSFYLKAPLHPPKKGSTAEA